MKWKEDKNREETGGEYRSRENRQWEESRQGSSGAAKHQEEVSGWKRNWAEESREIDCGEEMPRELKQELQSVPKMEVMYADSPGEVNFLQLQQNLQNCLAIIDNEVMKSYVPALRDCKVVPLEKDSIEALQHVHFFRISGLVYQEDEFSVHKLATVFHTLSNKPCTLVLMIRSDGHNNDVYLGVRSRDPRYSTGTMRQLLEQSLLGLFPGSETEEYFDEQMCADLKKLDIGSISSVTCIADYKQDKESMDDKEYVQGLEKLIYGMQGKPFTAICIANNLGYRDLTETKKEYEQIYTLMSPFANMQYSYALNNSSSSSQSSMAGISRTESKGISRGSSTTQSTSDTRTQGSGQAYSRTDTAGSSISDGRGQSHTVGSADGVQDSETTTGTVGMFSSVSKNTGINVGTNFGGMSSGMGISGGMSASVSRGKTHGTSHTDSISDSISRNISYGMNASRSVGNTVNVNESNAKTISDGTGTQYSENESLGTAANYAYTKALTDTFGSSQTVALNVQNKSLQSTLQRLEKQLARLDECESSGMWDFAAYFLGESAAEAETAASMYRSLISGNQSGLENASVNTWTDDGRVEELSKYITNFLHPVFQYQFDEGSMVRQMTVDATALASTNELAIQLGLPRRSIKGLPVMKHASFAQEVLSHTDSKDEVRIQLGEISHLGRLTGTQVSLNLQSLSMHTFITGSTGTGKSNTVYQMLSQLSQHQIPFLVIEPAKGEYKNVFGSRTDVAVFGTNPSQARLLRMNPFSFPQGIHIQEHLDRLIEIFNVCWPMYAAMPAVLKDAIERSYERAGWDLLQSKNRYSDQLFPSFLDVLEQIEEVMDQSLYSADNKSDYKGALCTRLRSLTNGINGLIFNSDEITSQELFDRNVIIDLSRVGSHETKALIMGLLIIKLQEYRMVQCHGMNNPLRHVTVLEEAHNLLKRTSTEQSMESANVLGKSVEMLSNAIAEMRTYGEGFVIADQSPGLLDMSVIRNTNTKIIMRLPEYSDRELVGRAVGLSEDQIEELFKLKKGVAAVYQSDWLEAVLCQVKRYEYEEGKQEIPFKPVVSKVDVKGPIISRMLAGEFGSLIDRVDENMIRSNLSAAAKCRLFDYVQTPESDRMEAAAAVAYELFSARQAFAALSGRNPDYEQQKQFLIDHLTPPLRPLPAECRQKILYLVTYWDVRMTGSRETGMFLQNLIDTEQKEKIVL